MHNKPRVAFDWGADALEISLPSHPKESAPVAP